MQIPDRNGCDPQGVGTDGRLDYPFWQQAGVVRYAVVASRGVWRSLVARFVRDEEVVGSNPATPTREIRWYVSYPVVMVMVMTAVSGCHH